MSSVLVIEDAPEYQTLIKKALSQHDLDLVTTLSEGKSNLASPSSKYDLIVLDLSLPDGEGLDLLNEIASSCPPEKQPPVFILSGRTSISDKVAAFSLGADDYICKPFNMMELAARVEAKIKKHGVGGQLRESVSAYDLEVDMVHHKVKIGPQGHVVDLSPIEYKLLCLLARNPTKILSREHLYKEIWGRSTHVSSRTVDVHISHLRRKITDSATKIETIPSEGYRLVSKQ